MTRLLITSGRGPAECRIALGKLVAIIRWGAQARGLDMELVEARQTDEFGPASVIAVLYGDREVAERFAGEWVGSVQWISKSPIRPHHKRKNWFVGVVALPETEEVYEGVSQSDVRFETFRAGGPGGQRQNTTESAVRAVHKPTGLSAAARDERSQHRNKALALSRLASLLKLCEEIATIADRQQTQTAHDQLQRGRPVRRFRGEKFLPEPSQ